jgi:hypothetical protein
MLASGEDENYENKKSNGKKSIKITRTFNKPESEQFPLNKKSK